MRKPKPTTPSSGNEAPTPAGGRALGRAQQFTFARGLTPPVVDTPPAAGKPAKQATGKTTATPAAKKPARKPAKKPA